MFFGRYDLADPVHRENILRHWFSAEENKTLLYRAISDLNAGI
jgi:hypothetical protein